MQSRTQKTDSPGVDWALALNSTLIASSPAALSFPGACMRLPHPPCIS